jgi:integrase
VCCRDFNADADTLAIRQSKGGKVRHVFLTQDARKLFLTWTVGRSATAQIFLRDDGERWGKSHQLQPIADASEAAQISPPATFNVLRHTHASHLAMAATPMGVIAAQLGHVDTRMAEKHYAHLAPSYIADTIRAKLPALGVVREADSPEANQ